MARPAFQTIKALAKPALKSAAKHVGQELLEGGVKIASKALSGENFKEAIKDQIKDSAKRLKKKP